MRSCISDISNTSLKIAQSLPVPRYAQHASSPKPKIESLKMFKSDYAFLV
jgi:hypothetical protein